jgi:hypothetical protein
MTLVWLVSYQDPESVVVTFLLINGYNCVGRVDRVS